MTTAVREKPILFSAPMVRAILEGRKTQTRRIVKPQPEGVYVTEQPHPNRYGIEKMPTTAKGQPWWSIGGVNGCPKCPYGKVGDRLWVRETWSAYLGSEDAGSPRCVAYKADGGDRSPFWKPSTHMPRWASRITLEVTDVRCERLQAISGADAKAEGCSLGMAVYPQSTDEALVGLYRELWDKINGKSHPWASNPWVWVVEFRRVEEAN